MTVTPFSLSASQYIWMGGNSPGSSGFRLNNSAYQILVLFKAPATQNLNSLRLRVSSTAGTVTNIGLLELLAVDSNYFPTGSALASQAFTPSTSGVQTVTFGTPYGCTANVWYCLRITNTDGVPATNRFDIILTQSSSGAAFTSGAVYTIPESPILSFVSIDSGSTYSSPIPTMAMNTIFATYGTHGTVIWATPASGSGSGIGLYNVSGSRVARQASLFNLAEAKKLSGIAFAQTIGGAPTYRLKGEIISSGGTVLATSDSAPVIGNFTTMVGVLFSTPYTMSALTDYYLSITAEGASDGDASNFYRVYGSTVFDLNYDSGILRGSFESTASPGPSWSAAPYIFGIFPVFENASNSGAYAWVSA